MINAVELLKDVSDPRTHNNQSLIESMFELDYDEDTDSVYLLSLRNVDLSLSQGFIVDIPSHLYRRGDLNPYQVYLPDDFWEQVKEFSSKSLINASVTFNIDRVINTNNIEMNVSDILLHTVI